MSLHQKQKQNQLTNRRLGVRVRLGLIVHQRRVLPDRLVHGHIVRQHVLPDQKLQLVLEPTHRDHRGRVDIVNVLLGVFLAVNANATVAAHHQVSLDRLHQCERINLDGATLPLAQVRTLGVTLQVALWNGNNLFSSGFF